jgi:hypothetical protein
MKPAILVLFFFLPFSTIEAQETKLTGAWTMFELAYVSIDGIQKKSEDQMKADESVTDFYFMEDSKFRQTSNMSGTGTLDTYEGTYKVNGKELIITLQIGERSMEVDYTWEIKENALVLTRTSPDGKMKIVAAYRKKFN